MSASYSSFSSVLPKAPSFSPPVAESTLPVLSAILLALAFGFGFYSTTLSKARTSVPVSEMGYAAVASLTAGFGVVLLFASVGVNV
ncbi:hypothetical protein BT69DRAFT_1333478 [Atractiella rhizophila]|nr:hypothetical protein BT69DRAFT_1351839 [Atractiella rhizophila]KAH8923874.1 hypothetical protein BT69DRAFT_1333478 [Atractiella rhizophila]